MTADVSSRTRTVPGGASESAVKVVFWHSCATSAERKCVEVIVARGPSGKRPNDLTQHKGVRAQISLPCGGQGLGARPELGDEASNGTRTNRHTKTGARGSTLFFTQIYWFSKVNKALGLRNNWEIATHNKRQKSHFPAAVTTGTATTTTTTTTTATTTTAKTNTGTAAVAWLCTATPPLHRQPV